MASTTSNSEQSPAHSGPATLDLAAFQTVLLGLTQSENDSGVLLQKMLGLIVGLTGARAGANFRLNDPAKGPELMHGLWPEEFNAALPNLPTALGALSAEAISSGRAGIKPLNDLGGRFATDRWVGMAAPVLWQDRPYGAMCLVLDLAPNAAPEPFVAVLQAVAACFQIHVHRRLGGAHQLLSQQMSVVLDAVGRSVAARNATEMAYFLANEIHQHLDCHQVAIGWRTWRGQAKVAAISGQARFNKRGDLARAIRDAMSEVVRQERQVSASREAQSLVPDAEAGADDEGDLTRPIDLAHETLLDVCQTDLAMTYPLCSGDEVIGAWTFQWRKDRLPTPADERLVPVATGQVGPVVAWARRADQGVLKRGARSIGQAATTLIGPGHLVAKAITFGVVALLGVLVFVRVPFRVGGECVLQPTPRRYITARFDGVLKEAYVRPGDLVTVGKPLADLEDYELRDELGLAKAEWHEAKKESDALWAKGEFADAQLAQIRADKAQARIDLLEFKLGHVKITAPMDGMVLSGDLERAQGVPVQRGQTLFELAPLDRMILEVSVPDADAAYVAAGQTGEFSLQARPERTVAFAVERVRPQAEIRDEKNAFVVEAAVENAEGWLRPGMQGTAKVGVDRRPLGWVLTRRIVNWFRMKFWW